MSAWSSQQRSLFLSRRGLGATKGIDLLLVAFLGVTLLVRVLTDDLASPESRQSGTLNLSGLIAALFIVVSIGLLFRRRRGLRPAVLAALWLCAWTGVAVITHGATAETIREGVREASVVALAVIVYNASGAFSVPTAARLVQLIGFAPAVLALYQLATRTGLDIHGILRSNGTFVHPDSAAMFFAIAAVLSLWLYLDDGRHGVDALFTTLFAVALISTLSIDGLIALAAMMISYGLLRPGPLRVKLGPCIVAGLVIVVFLATPLGANRIRKETSTSVAAAERGEPNTSLAWRLDKWKTLLPGWEQSPFFGQGLGTTTTTTAIPGNRFAGKPPHNEYVRYLVETGGVGLAILLSALALLIRKLVRRRRISGDPNAGSFTAATLAVVVIVGCLVNSLADNTLLNSPTCYAAALVIFAALTLPADDAGQARIAQRV